MAENQQNDNDKFTDKELYNIALKNRDSEISLFWQRSNYFLVLNSGIAVGFFQDGHENIYSLIFCLLGLFSSILWFRVNLGSKYWQARWENVLARVEEKIFSNTENPRIKFFTADRDELKEDVEANLNSLRNDDDLIGRNINSCILKKPSVSKSMIYLSILFCIGWSLLLLCELCNALFQLLEHMKTTKQCLKGLICYICGS